MTRVTRTNVLALEWGWSALLAIVMAGCGDPGPTASFPDASAATSTGPFAVSEPMASLVEAVGPGQTTAVTWLSLPPDSIADGLTATIRNLRNGASVDAAMLNGGFDPVPLPAVAGDTLLVVIRTADGTRTFAVSVPSSSSPRVVRTDPPPHKRDVPLNAAIRVVFSEPMDGSTLDSVTVQLHDGSDLVRGTLAFASDSHVATIFRPATRLRPGTDYELVLRDGIRDLSGESLRDTVTVPFTTTASDATSALTLVGSWPVHGSIGVPVLDSAVRLWFSEPIATSTLRDATGDPRFKLMFGGDPGDQFTAVDAELRCAGAQGSTCESVEIAPKTPLAAGTMYHVFVGTGVRGQYGGELPSPIDLWFTTAVAVVDQSTIARFELLSDGGVDVVGMPRMVLIMGIDARGIYTGSERATVTSSDTKVAALRRIDTYTVSVPQEGRTVQMAEAYFDEIAAGVTTIRATLDGVTDSLVLRVASFPTRPAALVVDTFTVVEYHVGCAGGGCDYLLYAPLLRLREPTGESTATVEAIEFTIPTMSTSLCRTYGLTFTPGLSAHVNGIDPYPWNNDMIFMPAPWGIPVPDGLATARFLVRDAGGELGVTEVTAPIQRNVKDPIFPPPNPNVGWSCVG